MTPIIMRPVYYVEAAVWVVSIAAIVIGAVWLCAG